jgi:hypothetical protein
MENLEDEYLRNEFDVIVQIMPTLVICFFITMASF